MKSNCLVFALCNWWSKGGYLIVRRSRVGWWPHFLWTESLDNTPVRQFVPVEYKRNLLFPPLIFNGHIRGCDKQRKCKFISKKGGCKFCLDWDDENDNPIK